MGRNRERFMDRAWIVVLCFGMMFSSRSRSHRVLAVFLLAVRLSCEIAPSYRFGTDLKLLSHGTNLNVEVTCGRTV